MNGMLAWVTGRNLRTAKREKAGQIAGAATRVGKSGTFSGILNCGDFGRNDTTPRKGICVGLIR